MVRSVVALLLLGIVAGCAPTNADGSAEEPEVKGGKKGKSKNDDDGTGSKNDDTTTPQGAPGGGDGDKSSGGSCTAKTCTQLGVTCGTHDNGCGAKLEC